MRVDLFHASERYPVPISSFAIPSDVSILGSSFGNNTYYADFAGVAKKYRPHDILEIGVRFGYSGIAMCLGALAGHEAVGDEFEIAYDGIDACFFSHPQDPTRLSHDVAAENFRRMLPSLVEEMFYHCDTRYGLPEAIVANRLVYDLINVDGDHSFEGCYRDLTNVWPLAAPGAILIVDDTGMEGVRRAIEQFRDERTAELAGFQWYENERGWAIFQKEN